MKIHISHILNLKMIFLIALVTFKCNVLLPQDRIDCKLIRNILAYKEVEQKFYLKSSSFKEIIIVDHKKFLGLCSPGKLFGKKIIILNDSTLLKTRFYPGILISGVKIDGDLITLYLFQKSSGASGNVKVRRVGNKFVKQEINLGNF